jgi:hypothetical protein
MTFCSLSDINVCSPSLLTLEIIIFGQAFRRIIVLQQASIQTAGGRLQHALLTADLPFRTSLLILKKTLFSLKPMDCSLLSQNTSVDITEIYYSTEACGLLLPCLNSLDTVEFFS